MEEEFEMVEEHLQLESGYVGEEEERSFEGWATRIDPNYLKQVLCQREGYEHSLWRGKQLQHIIYSSIQ